MELSLAWVRLTKRYPLRISRGVSTGSENLFVTVRDGDLEGVGEGAPGVGSEDSVVREDADRLQGLVTPDLLSQGPERVDEALRPERLDRSVLAALDIALWDLRAVRAGQPLADVLGLPAPHVPTSVTIGINPPEVIRERVSEIIARTGARCLKVKLGSPEGVEHDQASYEAALASVGPEVRLRVDANGGWGPGTARRMAAWLAERRCDYVEQPLARGEEAALPEVFEGRPLPIFLDESCQTSADVPLLADRCDGVNVKLMKTGGITEALRVVSAARVLRLGTMIGCMGESSVAIAAGVALSGLFDHVDLDSHLNLDPDPAEGLGWEDGVVLPSARPGHGARLRT